jgi:hypothetical protein
VPSKVCCPKKLALSAHTWCTLAVRDWIGFCLINMNIPCFNTAANLSPTSWWQAQHKHPRQAAARTWSQKHRQLAVQTRWSGNLTAPKTLGNSCWQHTAVQIDCCPLSGTYSGTLAWKLPVATTTEGASCPYAWLWGWESARIPLSKHGQAHHIPNNTQDIHQAALLGTHFRKAATAADTLCNGQTVSISATP